jgi:hypothetical protein
MTTLPPLSSSSLQRPSKPLDWFSKGADLKLSAGWSLDQGADLVAALMVGPRERPHREPG